MNYRLWHSGWRDVFNDFWSKESVPTWVPLRNTTQEAVIWTRVIQPNFCSWSIGSPGYVSFSTIAPWLCSWVRSFSVEILHSCDRLLMLHTGVLNSFNSVIIDLLNFLLVVFVKLLLDVLPFILLLKRLDIFDHRFCILSLASLTSFGFMTKRPSKRLFRSCKCLIRRLR